MLRQIPTLLLVSLVTLLIWAFAEAETLRSRDVVMELVFEPDPEGDRTIEVRSASAAMVGVTQVLRPTVYLEGSAHAVDEAERTLRKPLRLDPYSPAMPRQPGEHAVSLRDLVREHPDLALSRVTIKRVEPVEVFVQIDEMASVDAAVRVEVGAGDLEGTPEARPARARIRVPSRLASSLPPDAYVIASPDAPDLERALPGRRETISNVRLSLPPTLATVREARIQPPMADVVLTLRSRTPTSKALTVPVQVVMAGIEQSKWDVVIDAQGQFVSDVTVTGPAEFVRQIDSRQLAVVALLPLSFAELEGGNVTSKDVVFTTMPPVGAPLKFEAPKTVVSFKATRRASPAP